MKVKEREEARRLRKEGYSIAEIVKKTKSAKGSVSLWVRDIILTESQKNKISKNGRSFNSIEKRRRSRLENENKKIEFAIKNAKKDLISLNKKDLMMIGISLYIGEGSKTKKGTLSVTNSDPSVIMIMLRFFREVCGVPENKFRCHIHTFEGNNIEETEKYWEGVTKIPRKQFYKTYAKASISSLSKRKTLSFGTLDLSVNDTQLFLRVMGWIEKTKELLI